MNVAGADHMGTTSETFAMPSPDGLKTINPKACRALLKKADIALDEQFSTTSKTGRLLRMRARFIDSLLQRLWEKHALHMQDTLALIGTGGYGREELHPHSDIDLLILIDGVQTDEHRELIEIFVAFLWELKLNVSHSVRTVKECLKFAEDDISIFTSLLESRCIAGNLGAHNRLMDRIDSTQLWPSQAFCAAKLKEQEAREVRYSSTSFNLQPDIKNSPGGLREIQTLLWITRRHFRISSLNYLVDHKFLTTAEVRLLRGGRDFLWRVRYLMHRHSGRCNDRLDFESQRRLATIFGYRDSTNRLAVEQFMATYYRWVSKLRVVSNLLVRHFEEHILLACENQHNISINKRFVLRNNFIDAKNPSVFKENPSALLEIFVLLAQEDNIRGIRAATLRLIYKHRSMIDKEYRANPQNARRFMNILKSGKKVGHVLDMMRRYEILGRWLPEFAKLHGQMQHDLFHVYTVDVHLVAVARNINWLMYPDSGFSLIASAPVNQQQDSHAHAKTRSDFGLPTQVARVTPKPELLYIAALYHDIAKGRKGDHSKLGVKDVLQFAKRHGLHRRDAVLLAFLVRHHLLMSITAQHKDCLDPIVLKEFSEVVGNIERLNHLYVLTVADICATNPQLWNGWRASLLHQLYLSARQWLLRDNQKFIDRKTYLLSIKDQALLVLKKQKVSVSKIKALWAGFDSEYFIREKLDDIVWQTAAIVKHTDTKPLVILRKSGEFKFKSTVQIFVYSKHKPNILSILSNTLECENANIQYAHIIDTDTQHVLCSFFVLPRTYETPETPESYGQTLINAIQKTLSARDVQLKTVRYLDAPELKAFQVPLQVKINYEQDKSYNILEITTVDRFGLLSCLTQSLGRLRLQLRGARITTLGERVDDVFYITDEHGHAVQDNEERALLESFVRRDIESWVNTGTIT